MMSRKKLTAVIIILLLAIAMVFLLIKNNADTESTSTIRYAAPLTIAAAPVYVADSMGFWDEEGIDVEVTYFDSGRKALDALLSNNAELMSVSETPPLRAYLGGSKINVVSTVTEHKEAKLTVRTDKISKPEDIKGKRIGTVAGTNSDYYMYRWLEEHGIKVDEVEIIQLDAGPLAQAFVQGDVDAMFAWEPHNFNAYSKASTTAESWPTELYSGRHCIIMNTDYYDNNTDKAEKIIRGFIKAEEYIKNNPEDAKRIVREATGMSEDALNNLWEEYTYKVQLDDGLLDIINGEAAWIKSSENNASAVDLTQLVNPNALLNVDPSRLGGAFRP
jgi:ABC-type nitrate/sulfonate/bicarbonate transport system substrate-binding protein